MSKSYSWRDIARPIIARVLEENAGKGDKELKKALRDAYPFGERAYHPYKVWLDEIKVQTRQRQLGRKNTVVPKAQIKLF